MSEETLQNFPGMKATVSAIPTGFFDWCISYSDGSGQRAGWSPTKRGAKQQAINECRRKSGNFSKIKFKWQRQQI